MPDTDTDEINKLWRDKHLAPGQDHFLNIKNPLLYRPYIYKKTVYFLRSRSIDLMRKFLHLHEKNYRLEETRDLNALWRR